MNRTTTILIVLIAGLVLADFLLSPHDHVTVPWHYPGGLAAVGFVSCIVVAVLSKGLGKRLLQRPENYDE